MDKSTFSAQVPDKNQGNSIKEQIDQIVLELHDLGVEDAFNNLLPLKVFFELELNRANKLLLDMLDLQKKFEQLDSKPQIQEKYINYLKQTESLTQNLSNIEAEILKHPLPKSVKERLIQEFESSKDRCELLHSYSSKINSTRSYVDMQAWGNWIFDEKYAEHQSEYAHSITFLELLEKLRRAKSEKKNVHGTILYLKQIYPEIAIRSTALEFFKTLPNFSSEEKISSFSSFEALQATLIENKDLLVKKINHLELISSKINLLNKIKIELNKPAAHVEAEAENISFEHIILSPNELSEPLKKTEILQEIPAPYNSLKIEIKEEAPSSSPLLTPVMKPFDIILPEGDEVETAHRINSYTPIVVDDLKHDEVRQLASDLSSLNPVDPTPIPIQETISNSLEQKATTQIPSESIIEQKPLLSSTPKLSTNNLIQILERPIIDESIQEQKQQVQTNTNNLLQIHSLLNLNTSTDVKENPQKITLFEPQKNDSPKIQVISSNKKLPTFRSQNLFAGLSAESSDGAGFLNPADKPRDVEPPESQENYMPPTSAPPEQIENKTNCQQILENWHQEILKYMNALPAEIQIWYHDVYNTILDTSVNTLFVAKASHLLRDILFEFQVKKDLNVIDAYMRLCPNPVEDLKHLLVLKPAAPIMDEPFNLSNCPEELKPHYLHYIKLNKRHPIEASLFLQGLRSVHSLKQTDNTEQPIATITQDPRYEPLKRHRGFLKLWEVIEDLYRLIVGKLFEKEEHEYSRRPCFFKTRSAKIMEQLEGNRNRALMVLK